MRNLLLILFIFFDGLTLYAQQKDSTRNSARTTFSQRIFRPIKGNSLYTRIYNRFWAVDTSMTERSSGNKSTWVAIPSVSYAPETHLNFQVNSLYSFYTDKSDPDLRNSSLFGTLSYSQLAQFKIHLRPTIWTKGNLWHLILDLSYQNSNFKFYGVGNHTHLADQELIRTRPAQIDVEAERLLLPHLYAGLTFIFQSFRNYSNGDGIFENSPELVAKYKGDAGFGGISLIFDNRDNQNYTTHGHYVRANAGFAPSFLSSTGAMQQYNFESRDFFRFTDKTTLGINVLFNANTGTSVPFYFMNSMGSDQIMRGYYTGRFRDKYLLAGQAEYRYLFFPRFGLAVFVGFGQVFGQSTFGINEFKPDYGLGGRYVFDIKSRITVRLDYGRGLAPAGEKTISGFYLSLGEAF